MNGIQHYREAEKLLAQITHLSPTVALGDEGKACIATAQVHATLALVALTAEQSAICGADASAGLSREQYDRWNSAF